MLLVGQQEGYPACKKTEWWGAGVVVCGARWRLACGPADATALTVSCFSKIQIGFTFLVPTHPGSPGQIAVKRVCVWVQCVLLLQFNSDERSQLMLFRDLIYPEHCHDIWYGKRSFLL